MKATCQHFCRTVLFNASALTIKIRKTSVEKNLLKPYSTIKSGSLCKIISPNINLKE